LVPNRWDPAKISIKTDGAMPLFWVATSLRTVQRVWQAHTLQPHRLRTFKRSTDPAFAEKVEDIVGLYMHHASSSPCGGAFHRREEPDPGPRPEPSPACP
jgi:hypothetical protein